MNRYDDIINLENYEPRFHKRMDRYNRAAQFASFAALKGYEDMIEEEARITDKKIELTEEEIFILNNKLNLIISKMEQHPIIKIKYFIKDSKKNGGIYKIINKPIKRINNLKRSIELINGVTIPISSIVEIEADIFKTNEL